MPTALAEWTPERPDVPGYYWWMLPAGAPVVADLRRYGDVWNWIADGALYDPPDYGTQGLWWPVRLEPPPVG